MRPPAKLARAPWKARPTARPQDARRATTLVIGTPRISTIAIMRIRKSRALMSLVMMLWALSSSFDLLKALAMAFDSSLMTMRPTTVTTMARTILPPYVEAISITLLSSCFICFLRNQNQLGAIYPEFIITDCGGVFKSFSPQY